MTEIPILRKQSMIKQMSDHCFYDTTLYRLADSLT